MAQQTTPPGLRYRTRADSTKVPYWIAPPGASAKGFQPRTVNLQHAAADPARLVETCYRLNREVTEFLAGRRESRAAEYDRSLRSLFQVYQAHPLSSFQKLAPSSRRLYETYLPELMGVYGHRRVDRLSGLDVAEWFDDWRNDKPPRDLLAAARAKLAVIKAALSFGIAAGFEGCATLHTAISAMKFEALRPRTSAPTVAQVQAHIAAAHEAGFPSMALADAIQFETTLRQWDVIGQWVPLSDPRPSSVLYHRTKWLGPTWANVDADLVLRWTPTKTLRSTGVVQTYDLKVCPLVMQEIARVPLEQRVGPLIQLFPGQPWQHNHYRTKWRAVADAAGLPKSLWSRDMRAGGVTEGRIAGATMDDMKTVAGHASALTTKAYDRDTVVAFGRVAEARARNRKPPGTA